MKLMKRILTCLMSIILIIASVPLVSMAQATEHEKAIDVTEELTTVEQYLVENNELDSGIYFNEKCRSFFEDKFNEESVFSINQEGFLELNFSDTLVLEDDYNKIGNYNTKDLSLIISINQNLFALEEQLNEQENGDYYIIDSINDTTDIAVFNTEKAVDFDEEMFYSYLIEIIDILEENHQNDTTEPEDNDKNSDIESDTSESTTEENVTESNNNDSSNTIIEEETTNIETPPTENSDENGTDDVLMNTPYINLTSETFSKIISFAFPLGNYQEEINSIFVSNNIKDKICSALETWYNNEYCLYNNEIKINESLILNSANNKSLENGIKYIFLGQDDDGNLLSVKLSDNINKNNGVLQLMNSNYSTLIVSYNQLLQNDIEINSDEYFCLMYCDDQLLIAVNTEKCEQNSIGAKESFNSIINAFLNEYRIESIQPYGIAVGNPIVYSGPGKNGYAAVGSLNPFDSYETIYKELGFQYIEYTVDGTNTKKRGYIDQYGGGSGTIPKYTYGQGGKIKNGCTVYSGPSSTYATVGSVSSGESVTLLTQARPTSQTVYWYLEYSSSSGTKRGYILSSNVNTISNTGLGVTLKDITVYDDYVVNSGSLYKNEYFVITGYNDNYYRIEYNITTNAARKTGYVFKSDVQSINNDATIPKVSNSDAIHAKPKQSTSIYAGPSEKIYANIGSVDNSDTVGVLGKEGSYYYIQYSTASGSKRGYIQISALNSFSGSSSIKSTGVESATAYADAPSSACTVYSCPDTTSATIGSIGAYEGITVFTDIKDRGFTFIEYSTAANTKRGFIKSSLLENYNEGVKRKANSDATIYYTTVANLSIGSIYRGEYVIVLGIVGNYYYIEYNSPSGRKRGYAKNTVFDSVSDVPKVKTTGESIKMNSAQNVYSGPSSTYAKIGSVSKDEYATLISQGNREGWNQIEYSTPNGSKQGYIPKSSATVISLPVNGEIVYPTYTNAIKHYSNYTSGLGRDLVYYTIGDYNSDNVFILNFAIHGHEDHYAGDGMGLVNMAFRTIAFLNNNCYSNIINNNWLIIIIPTFNPDGIIDGDNCKTGSNCQSIGRHNAVQMKHNDDGTWTKYTDGLGHIDLNRCFPNSADKSDFTPNYSDRYYTGPDPMMAYEAEALNELLQEYKSKTGIKYFIDIHGWTQQIIFAGESDKSPFVKAFRDHGFSNNTLTNTLATGGKGYVSRYAHYLGYQSCLFEFPSNTDSVDFYNGTYGNYFIESIKSLIDI